MKYLICEYTKSVDYKSDSTEVELPVHKYSLKCACHRFIPVYPTDPAVPLLRFCFERIFQNVLFMVCLWGAYEAFT